MGYIILFYYLVPTIEGRKGGMISVLTQSGLDVVQEVTKTFIANAITGGFTRFPKNYYFSEGDVTAKVVNVKVCWKIN